MTETEQSGQASSQAAEEENVSAERLLLFTDAVVAIAITLLVLPLVDIVPEAVSEHAAASEVITRHLDQFGSFLLGFVVIARQWLTHHKMFGTVITHRRSLVLWNLAWLLVIVVVPFTTEMVGAYGHNLFVGGLYYLSILAGVICQMGMVWVLRAHPELLRGSTRRMNRHFADLTSNACALVVALALALLVPATLYYSLLMLMLPPVIDRFRGARAEREAAAV